MLHLRHFRRIRSTPSRIHDPRTASSTMRSIMSNAPWRSPWCIARAFLNGSESFQAICAGVSVEQGNRGTHTSCDRSNQRGSSSNRSGAYPNSRRALSSTKPVSGWPLGGLRQTCRSDRPDHAGIRIEKARYPLHEFKDAHAIRPTEIVDTSCPLLGYAGCNYPPGLRPGWACAIDRPPPSVLLSPKQLRPKHHVATAQARGHAVDDDSTGDSPPCQTAADDQAFRIQLALPVYAQGVRSILFAIGTCFSVENEVRA